MKIFRVIALQLILYLSISEAQWESTEKIQKNVKLDCENWQEKPAECCECDPRPNNGTCCDPSTCKLFSHATCADGDCCDLSTCQLRTAATVCRFPKNACDLPEYCSGIDAHCPRNVYKTNFVACRTANYYCFEAECQLKTRTSYKKPSLNCPNDCSGNGECNNLGNCHCEVGFSGRECLEPGPGGSVDSGPATNPHFLVFQSFNRFTYIAFCGAIPLVVLLNFCICICGDKINCHRWCKEPQKYRPSNASRPRSLATVTTNIRFNDAA